jgi:murein DD-endopeptidase MepM/ murein hydrolase activator NlpD
MSHPTAMPPAFTPTTLPAVDQVSGVYVVLQGVAAGSGEAAVLMGGYQYLQWSDAGNAVHEAVDLNSMGGGDSDLGAAVVAPLGGIVTDVLWWSGASQGFGNHLALYVDDVRAAEPCYVHAAHLDTMVVIPGQRVVAGQALGSCGKSGYQPYAHVHLALWYDVPPGGWDWWGTGYSREWVDAHTLDPQAWFWGSVAKADALGGQPPPPEVVAMLSDWELLNWVMPDLWAWAGVPYNPEALTSKAWLKELREGRYRGRPRTADRRYGDGRGDWAEFDAGVVVTRSDSGEWSWHG